MVPTLRCTSRIERVSVYARGALVTRRVELPQAAPEGPVDLLVPEISPLAEPGAMRAETGGARLVLGVRPRLLVPERAAGGGELREKLRALERDRARLESRQAEQLARREGLVSLSPHPALNGRSRKADPSGRFQDALAVNSLADALARDLDAQAEELDRLLEENFRLLAAAQAELAQATSRERALPGHPTWEVTVHLAAGSPLTSCELSYPVAAARWWPAYSARIAAGAGSAELALESFVAQASFEDWTGVRLSLCTADMASDTRLPELPSLRLGRAQAPRKKGFREPPEGLDVLFLGYDQAMAGPATVPQGLPVPPLAKPRPEPLPPPESKGELVQDEERLEEECLEDGAAYEPEAEPDEVTPVNAPAMEVSRQMPAKKAMISRSRGAPPPPPRMPPSAPGAAPMSPAPTNALAKDLMPQAGGGASFGKVGSATLALPEPEPEIDADTWLDFDSLALPEPDAGRRGRLTRASALDRRPYLASAAAQIESASPPGSSVDPLHVRGEFDHRFDAEGPVDVPSNGLPHRLTLGTANAPIRPRFRCVPREGDEVYREAVLNNPFPAPLIGGPLDVFMDGALLSTSPIAPVGRGGPLTLGLGVEERLRAVRNASAKESAKGLISGTTAIDHLVSVEVASALGREVELEILERLPVSDDKDVKIIPLEAKPQGAKYDQSERGAPLRGGLCFRLAVGAGAKATLTFGYRVELPAKLEIVGGNRRE